jgi:hypothetical protein
MIREAPEAEADADASCTCIGDTRFFWTRSCASRNDLFGVRLRRKRDTVDLELETVPQADCINHAKALHLRLLHMGFPLLF